MSDRNRVFRFELDVKCGFCNFRTQNHYVIASSEEEAEELLEEAPGEADRKGFCAGCLVDEVINNRLGDGEPNYELVRIADE